MDLVNLRNDLQERYLSLVEYMNSSFGIFRLFVKKHALVVFFHFLFSVMLGLFVSFFLWQPLKKLYEISEKYNTQGAVDMKEYATVVLTACTYLLGYFIISIVIEFIIVIIRKKIGLEIEDEIKEFKFSEVIVKFMIMTFANILIGIFIGIIAIIFSKFVNPLILMMVILLVIKLNILYFKQAYYLRNVNIIEAFKYNFHLSKGKRLIIIIPIVIIVFVTILINQFFGWILEAIIKNPQILGIVISIIAGIIKTISEIFTITIENVIYLNMEYIDLKDSEI